MGFVIPVMNCRRPPPLLLTYVSGGLEGKGVEGIDLETVRDGNSIMA